VVQILGAVDRQLALGRFLGRGAEQITCVAVLNDRWIVHTFNVAFELMGMRLGGTRLRLRYAREYAKHGNAGLTRALVRFAWSRFSNRSSCGP
jgi:hypothetical protein